MASEPVNTISLKHFPTLCQLGVVGNLSDAQLLELFLAGNKVTAEASFAVLVDRHGPMVLRVCQQILCNPDDAQDAFQATFLVLVRQAGTVRKRDSVASWLYGIALRVARRARADGARRQIHERLRALTAGKQTMTSNDEPECCWPELHDELGRLPEKYRESVVLCYLEGLSTQAAAQRLGCPQGTVLSRLSRARDQLRQRLTRRGLTLPAGLLTAGLATETAKAAVPPALACVVIQAAVTSTLYKAAGSAAISASAVQLSQGVLRTMFFSKLKMAAAAFIVVAALATGARVATQNLSDPGPQAIVAARGSQAVEQPPKDLKKYPALRDSAAVHRDLVWSEVPPAEWLQVLDMLVARTRANYEKIKTWKGSYSLLRRELLDQKFLASFPSAPKKVEPLIHEIDFRVSFALDTHSGNIYRDRNTRGSRYFRPGTNEPAEGPVLGPDIRWIVTADQSLEFDREHFVLRAQLPGRPGTHDRHYAVRRPVQKGMAGDGTDPRGYFPNWQWREAEFYARELRGRLEDKQFKQIAQNLTLSQSEGPGGRWYWEQFRSEGTGASKVTFFTTIWSPQAGYNPVITFSSEQQPDGKLEARTEWQWRLFNDTYVPVAFKQVAYGGPDGSLNLQLDATLEDCVVNRPLDPHQFDPEGLGLKDGDEVMDIPNSDESVKSILSNGKFVKVKDSSR